MKTKVYKIKTPIEPINPDETVEIENTILHNTPANSEKKDESIIVEKKSAKKEKSEKSSRKKANTKETETPPKKTRDITSYAMLKLYVNSDFPELKELYKEHCENHNRQVMNEPFPNSGFDLFIPEETVFEPGFQSKLVNLQIKTELCYKNECSAYFMYPRSSLSKTPLLLANHTGIIDSGYRGFLMGAFRSLDVTPYTVEQNTRLLQICHPSLAPIYVVLVEEEHLTTTARGEGGFGSTGLVGV